MRAFGAAQVLLGFCLGRWPPRGGWVFLFCFIVIYMQALCKRISPFGPAFKELVCSWELVVTNYLCRMMGKLERDDFCEADQIFHKLLPYWRHTYHIRNSHSNCQVWALSVFVPGNTQGQAIAGLPGAPDTLECLSSVRGSVGQNVSSVFGYFRHLTRF